MRQKCQNYLGDSQLQREIILYIFYTYLKCILYLYDMHNVFTKNKMLAAAKLLLVR